MGDAEPASADPRDAEGGGECAVCVCVHIRPLVAPELLEGCQECLSVTPGQPQARPCTRAQICALALVSSAEGPRVQVCAGPHSFTFDHVYGGGGGGASPELLYEECIQPLVAGLFAGFNATCLAYGQARRGAPATRALSSKALLCAIGGLHMPPRQCLPGDLRTSELRLGLVTLALSSARPLPGRHAECTCLRRRARGRRTPWGAPSRRTAGRAASYRASWTPSLSA